MRDTIENFCGLAIVCFFVVVVTFICVIIGEYFVLVAMRLGLTSAPSIWVIHLSGLFLALSVILSVGHRVVRKTWPWED